MVKIDARVNSKKWNWRPWTKVKTKQGIMVKKRDTGEKETGDNAKNQIGDNGKNETRDRERKGKGKERRRIREGKAKEQL